jgi:hypothetical protein
MDNGLTLAVILGSKEDALRLTVPENPNSAMMPIVDVDGEPPAVTVSAEGFADRLKSGPMTRTPTKVVWVMAGDVLVPLILTL